MKILKKKPSVLAHLSIVILAGGLSGATAASPNGQLLAGAARVDITPAESELPINSGRERVFRGIHDRLYLRAIVISDGSAQAAIVTADRGGFSHTFCEEVSSRIERATGIARDHVLLAATHTHSSPGGGRGSNDSVNQPDLGEKIVQLVKDAKAGLQAARVGVGRGRASVNINRAARKAGGGWGLGRNLDGPSDKTVHVILFETLSGDPIAILTNYGVHGTVMGPRNVLISGDIPGATSRFVEESYDDQVVVAWTSGAAGDQAPLYNQQDDFKSGYVSILGQMLGEETIRVAEALRTVPTTRIRARQKLVTCPGKDDAEGPLAIRLSVLMIGNIAIAGVSGEPNTMIGQRLKKESPFTETLMITHCNGASGYLPDDDAYQRLSYEIKRTHAKQGCAEDAIVVGLLELIGQL